MRSPSRHSPLNPIPGRSTGRWSSGWSSGYPKVVSAGHRPGIGRLTEELCDRFFATSSAAPFTDPSHRELLLELLETGTRDPLRWSTERVGQAIGYPLFSDGSIPLEVALDAPDLLRAFIPYAHAQSGIRDELTSRAIAVIDALRTSYKRKVLEQANYWAFGDAV